MVLEGHTTRRNEFEGDDAARTAVEFLRDIDGQAESVSVEVEAVTAAGIAEVQDAVDPSTSLSYEERMSIIEGVFDEWGIRPSEDEPKVDESTLPGAGTQMRKLLEEMAARDQPVITENLDTDNASVVVQQALDRGLVEKRETHRGIYADFEYRLGDGVAAALGESDHEETSTVGGGLIVPNSTRLKAADAVDTTVDTLREKIVSMLAVDGGWMTAEDIELPDEKRPSVSAQIHNLEDEGIIEKREVDERDDTSHPATRWAYRLSDDVFAEIHD